VDELDRDVMSVKGPLEHEAPQRRSATKAASEIESEGRERELVGKQAGRDLKAIDR
jgi:hypothetical protein